MTQHSQFDLLLESFGRNGRVNNVVLNAVSESDLTFTDGQGGWSIGQHLGHFVGFRDQWLSVVSPEHAREVPAVLEGDGQNFQLSVTSVAELARAFSLGDAAVKAAVLAALSEERAFSGAYESHPAHFLQHVLIHDAHHRGQVISLLRKSGRTPEEMAALEAATWPIWRE